MSSTHHKAAYEIAGLGDVETLLPVGPFTALQYHFGMLLGVDDLETAQAYPRGKIRLHNAWLHREGVVWGFPVSINAREELEVGPGLALDATGHELHLDTRVCLSIPKWYADNQNEIEPAPAEPAHGHVSDGESGHHERRERPKRFNAHLVIRFKACLTRPVPAISEPCAGAGSDTAYSRAFESVELLLRPGKFEPIAQPYHRLRLLFHLEEPLEDRDGNVTPEDQEVLDARAQVLARPADEQPEAYLEWFRRFAAFDVIDLAPARSTGVVSPSLFPETDPTELVLADVIEIQLEQEGSDWVLRAGHGLPKIDTTVRPSHVATRTIQELLCGPLFAAAGHVGRRAEGEGGPCVDPESVRLQKTTLRLETDKPLVPSSVDPEAFSVTSFSSEDGWTVIGIEKATVQTGRKVTLELKRTPPGPWIRLIARGTGATPLLGVNFVPLAGAIGGPPGSKHDGADFVHMWKRS